MNEGWKARTKEQMRYCTETTFSLFSLLSPPFSPRQVVRASAVLAPRMFSGLTRASYISQKLSPASVGISTQCSYWARSHGVQRGGGSGQPEGRDAGDGSAVSLEWNLSPPPSSARDSLCFRRKADNGPAVVEPKAWGLSLGKNSQPPR